MASWLAQIAPAVTARGIVRVRRVPADAVVAIAGARYSVPMRYVGTTVTIHEKSSHYVSSNLTALRVTTKPRGIELGDAHRAPPAPVIEFDKPPARRPVERRSRVGATRRLPVNPPLATGRG